MFLLHSQLRKKILISFDNTSENAAAMDHFENYTRLILDNFFIFALGLPYYKLVCAR